VAALVLILYLLATRKMTLQIAPQQIEMIVQSHMVVLAACSAVPVAALGFGLCYFCRRFLDRRPVQTMGLYAPVIGGIDGLVAGGLIGATPILLATAGLIAVGSFEVQGAELSLWTLIMIPVLLLLAFHEEIVVRGYLLQNLVDIDRPVFGVFFTSLVFWLIHSLNPSVWDSPVIAVNMFGAGIILAQAYLLSGNIWYPTLMHFAWNAAQGLLFSIPVSGLKLKGIIQVSQVEGASPWLTGAEFGLEGSVIVTVLELAMIVILGLAIRSRNHSAVHHDPIQGQPAD
jgi:membrane protease YdiL (CAAX protease family)